MASCGGHRVGPRKDAGVNSILSQRVQALEAAYRDIARTRMADMPLLNHALQVQAVGFGPCAGAHDFSLGVLVTPWFMNVLRLPLRADEADRLAMLLPGHTGERDLGDDRLRFVGAELPAIGRFEQCSLYSPMFEFRDQASAHATAQEVARLLHQGLASAHAAATQAAALAAEVEPARRGFLFGRSASRPASHG